MMGITCGTPRSRGRATLDIIVGAGQVAVGGLLGAFVISKAPDLYRISQELSQYPALSTAVPMAAVAMPAYLIMQGAMRIRNLRYEPENENDYAHKSMMQQLYNYISGASPQPYGSAPAAPETAPA